MATLFIQTIKSISGKFGFDPISNLPTFNVELGDIERPEYTLDEIFQYLSHADKFCIVAIDEFQQIAKYPEKNIEALLRTHIQRSENSHFIFAGSERHMMQEMFASAARPFYHSADMLELKAIPAEIYIPFIVGHFERRNRSIAAVDVEKVYALFQGHTYYIQKTFNESFADTPEGDECTLETIRAAIDNMIASNDTIFREICRTFLKSRRSCFMPSPGRAKPSVLHLPISSNGTVLLRPVRYSRPQRNCSKRILSPKLTRFFL